MQYVRLGNTGLRVSRICLGTMTYGSKSWRDWVLDEAERPAVLSGARWSRDQLLRHRRHVLDRASARRSPAARWRELARRDEVVIATKVYPVMGDGPNERGLSRKHILASIDGSLRALEHGLRRPVPDPPLGPDDADRGDAGGAERHRAGGKGALHRSVEHVRVAVREGARGVGRGTAGRGSSRCRTTTTWCTARKSGRWLPLCIEEGIGVIPWSPLARGFLAGNRTPDKGGETTRAKSDNFAHADVLLRRRFRGAASGGGAGRRARREAGAGGAGVAAAQAGRHARRSSGRARCTS